MVCDPSVRDRVYLFSYDFRGARWSLEIPAESAAEAQLRLESMARAQLDGEVKLKVGVPSGPFARVTNWLGLRRSSRLRA